MSENATQALIFVKTKQKPISMNEMRSSVIVISLCDSLIQSFYSSLSTFYAPLLLKSAQSKPLANDPKIQTALAELSAGLSLFLREQVSRNSECTNVLGLSDELEFWKSVSARQHGKKSERSRAELFVRLLEPAVKECLRLENSAFITIGPPRKIKTRLSIEDTGENHIGIALAELLDVLDTHITDSLDEVWRCLDPDATQPFPESRMRQLIEAIGYWIVKIVQMHLGCTEHNEQRRDVPYSVLWTLEFRQVKPGIQLGIKACKQWQKSSELLTQKLWRRYAPHPWEGPQPNLAYLTQFCARLTEVLNLRGLYEHLCRLLTRDERTELRMDRGLEHFLFGSWAKDMEFEGESSAPTLVRELFNPLLYNPYTAEQWASTMSMIDSKLRPAEERAASRLRTRLLMANPRGDIGSNQISPIQLLREFQTYQELIRRPIVSQILQAERETMLGYLEASLKEFREEFLKGTGAVLERKSASAGFSDRPVGMITAKNIPESINRILWAGHMESRVSDDLQLVEVLLSDLDRFGLYKQEAMSLIEDVATWRREQFEAWSRDRLARLADKKPKDQNMTLAFEPSGHLLTLSTTDGKLEVGYPDGLVQLQREVRLLTGLGYPVPSKLIKAADQGEALYRYAIVLKQVAHFYNSIDSQMIPSQQALMLNSALAFERLIKSPQLQLRGNLNDIDKGITWDQLSEVETYISQLQAASRQLMSENRKLRKVHFTIVEKIIRLLEVDLLRNQPRWRKATLEPFREWVVLGNLNLDELVDSHCRELIDFERNFKGLKTRGRDAEKLPNEIRIDCITVNCVPIKMSIEGLLQNLFEALQTCLRRSIQGDLVAADAFLTGKRDYEHFEMAPPSFATSDEVAKDLDEHEIMWTQYENFSTELEQLAREDWISFRSKCYLFDEFLTTWFNKLRSTEANPMTVRLQKEIDHYWEVVPALKWVRGDVLSPDHWLELFRLIGLPRGTKLDQLTFGDLLRVSRSIVEHTETLKNLTHRAQAEVVVREALQELDVWGAGATFTLTDYIDSSGQTVCLVKDWKDIVSQVRFDYRTTLPSSILVYRNTLSANHLSFLY
ncbi:Cytoplasmic dynein 2 heavy chain 1 isoform 1 [Fasciola gigantica]|uniref:Cytoplasmic dynein 2 heavy chain 1 isoform 1 n=1 Tax=Fasciola gigantica TaxID=46835 RepID=A0A504YX40_FASGI|nr:Cytoplasmic dynein 2 heavy chain 1 isoform 1 [Fasciola gigantica]